MAGAVESGERLSAGSVSGLVIGSGRGGEYLVHAGTEALSCRLRGRLKAATGERLDRLAVGDRVEARRSLDEPDRGVIETVLPRTNVLGRGRAGKPPQVIAANLDQVVIVLSTWLPDFTFHTVDRYLAVAAASEIPALVIINKCDLDRGGAVLREVEQVYRPLAVPVLGTSAAESIGLRELSAWLAGRVSAVIGPSGAGKSSLLNAVNPGYALRTGAVMSIGKGRHTTTESRLLPLDSGGWVADTPGIKTIQLIDGAVAPEELQTLFPELEGLADECRFADCTHRTEPGCRVDAAVAEGRVARSRYDSYRRLFEELEASAKPW